MEAKNLEVKLFGRNIAYKWIVLSVTTIGALMAAIDSTIVILGLPDMMVKLHADLIEMIWVIMGYILVSTVFLLAFGRVADMFGRVRMYNLGFVIFTIGSALCGFSGFSRNNWPPSENLASRGIKYKVKQKTVE